MAARPQVLGDHRKQGKTLVAPFNYQIGPLRDVSWRKTIIPEVCWLGLVQHHHGHQRGVALITSCARTARAVKPNESPRLFAAASSYADLSECDWTQLRERLALAGHLVPIQEAVEPLVALYPDCPLSPLFATPPTKSPDHALRRISALVSSLFNREDPDTMMIQATVIWLAFDADAMKVAEGLALSHFREIERYPDTDLSLRVAAAIRATLSMFFCDAHFYPCGSPWPNNFWNRGLTLAPCEVQDG